MEETVEELDLYPVRHRGGRPQARRVRLSRHAVERWSERVGTSPATIPASALEHFVSHGRRRPRPRHWTTTRAEPGTTFVYLADQPGICVVLRGRVAVTVLSRELCRRNAR